MNAVIKPQPLPKIDGYHTVIDPDSVFKFEYRVGYEIRQYGKRNEANPWDSLPFEVYLRSIDLIPYDGHPGVTLNVDEINTAVIAQIELEIEDKLDAEQTK